VVAITAAFLGIFARKPVGKEDMSLAVEKLLLNYEAETFLKLKRVKEEEKSIREDIENIESRSNEIRDYIENRSNEIFLLKIRSYLLEEIESAYRDSYLAKLIGELEKIEGNLDAMNITYESVKLPERFKEVMREINEEERRDLYLELLDLTSVMFPLSSKLLKKIYTLFYRQKSQNQK